jgi:hypothetical protein
MGESVLDSEVYSKVLNKYRHNSYKLSHKRLEEILDKQEADGSFQGIPKIRPEDGYDFRFNHCGVIRNLAVGYFFDKKESYKDAVISGLNWWINLDFNGTPNWYNTSIVIPNLLLDIVIYMQDELPSLYKEFMLKSIISAVTDERYVYDIGFNIVTTNTLKLLTGCLLLDQTMFSEALNRVEEEIDFADHHRELKWRDEHWRSYVKVPIEDKVYEGVQRDYSFLEHGPLLHTGFYGKNYLNNVVNFMYILSETDCVSQRGVKFITDFVLEHYLWTIVGDKQDYNVMGRSIVVECFEERESMYSIVNGNQTYITMLDKLLLVNDIYRVNELEEASRRLKLMKNPVSGSKYFPQGKYMVHQETDFKTTVRITSKNQVAAESCNWEHLQCWNMGDGVQFTYTDGDNYKGIWSTLDWKKLPGATIEYKKEELLNTAQHMAVLGSNTDYCGGLSDIDVSLSAMEVRRGELSGKVAWFNVGSELICLGMDINCNSSNNVNTTINQCLLRSDVFVDGKTISENSVNKELKLDGVTRIEHDHIIYELLNEAKCMISCENVVKDRYNITYKQSPNRPSEPLYVSNDIFELWISHGTHVRGGKYAYKIYPKLKLETTDIQTPTAQTSKPLTQNAQRLDPQTTKVQSFDKQSTEASRIIVNNNNIQAVQYGETFLIVFWEKGSLKLANKTITVEQSCVVIVKDNKLQVGKLKNDNLDKDDLIVKMTARQAI